MKYRIFSLLALFAALFAFRPAGAQTGQPDGPVYIVQAGDTLWDIAVRFGVPMDALAQANGMTDGSQLAEGAQLVIPGLEGLQGVLVTESVPFGETLRSLSRRYGVPEDLLARLNHLSTPAGLYVGYNLVVPQARAAGAFERAALAPGQTLLELAALNQANPWAFVMANRLSSPWQALPGDVLLLPGAGVAGPGALPAALPAPITQVEADPFPLLQGRTAVVRLYSQGELALSGSLMGYELHFYAEAPGRYVALQGVHALAEPGIYPLSLQGELADGTPFAYSQMVSVGAVNYPFDRPLTVDPATIDPAVTKPEDAEWFALTRTATPEKLWQGAFALPSSLPKDYCLESGECWTSRFGNRRSYNGGPYSFFHTGLDVAGGLGAEIYAPAPGVVVFAGPLTVRGNATVIDHGWGVYSAYMHQSEFKVQVGDRVKTGQLIGLVGGTGRVEGPHLHWEIWAGGVQVDPLEWLEKDFP